VRVFGDYDADGICATALLFSALEEAGCDADFRLPHRIEDGYGLSPAIVEEAARDGVSLLITVDCGSSNRAEVLLAKELGVEIIVTDHHALPASLNESVVSEKENPSPFEGEARRGFAEDSETDVDFLQQEPSPDPSLEGRGSLPTLVSRSSKIQHPKSQLQLSLDPAKLSAFLSAEIASAIERPAGAAKIFLSKDSCPPPSLEKEGEEDSSTELPAENCFGEPRVEGAPRIGLSLDFEGTRRLLLAALRTGAERVFLPFHLKEPELEIAPEVVQKFGIDSLLAVGWSDFSDSIPNREHNIAVGLARFDNFLLPPGEEFSFNARLGPVTAAAGYLPSYVISGEGTIFGLGGGLCQVATTVYRGALLSGMPITARRPHRYHVNHYDPAGSDATIYPPQPDLRWRNDTGAHLLLRAWAEDESKSSFVAIFGKSDGRRVELRGPWKSRWVKPPAPRVVKDPALPAGKVIVDEWPAWGVDALWEREITWPTRAERPALLEKIESRYTAWPEIRRIGVG
jgi:hypothetical protein